MSKTLFDWQGLVGRFALLLSFFFVLSCASAPAGTVGKPSFSPAGGSYTSAQSVTISTSTSGATLRYTTDGSTPTETHGTVYSSAVTISATTTLQAIGYKSGDTDSSIASATYTISGGTTVATPTFSPAGGTYSSAQSVTISTSTSGATLRYTIDGSTPTETHGTVYSSAVAISSTTTLQAIGYKSGNTDSSVASATYTITSTVATPTFSPGGGTYSSAQSVTISTSTPGATIRYTTNGSTPSETHGTVYSSPVAISATTTLQAIGYESGDTDSSVASATYTISGGSVATPSFSPAAGPFYSATAVTITSTTPGAAIYYTTDGSTPSATHGTLYQSPVTMQVAVDTNMTASTASNGSGVTMLKAIAIDGTTSSTIFTGNYIIISPLRYTQTTSDVLGLAHFAYNVTTANWTSISGIWTNDLGYAVVETTGTSPNRFQLIKINDQQFIELYEVTSLPGTSIGGYPAQWQLRNFGYYVTDAAAFQASLPSGANIVSGTSTNALGNLSFFTQDPDGHLDEWVQYVPGSVTSNTLGQYMPGTQLFGYMEDYGDATANVTAADNYYNLFGFGPGSTKVYLPNNNCYIEMLTYQNLNQTQAGKHEKAQLVNFRGNTIQQSAAIVLARDPSVTYLTGTEGGSGGFPTHTYYDLYNSDLSRIRLIDINY